MLQASFDSGSKVHDTSLPPVRPSTRCRPQFLSTPHYMNIWSSKTQLEPAQPSHSHAIFFRSHQSCPPPRLDPALGHVHQHADQGLAAESGTQWYRHHLRAWDPWQQAMQMETHTMINSSCDGICKSDTWPCRHWASTSSSRRAISRCELFTRNSTCLRSMGAASSN